MHLLVECLPLLTGLLAGLLFRTAPVPVLRTVCLMLLPLSGALLANFLSGEGAAGLAVDILKAGGGTAVCLLFFRTALRPVTKRD